MIIGLSIHNNNYGELMKDFSKRIGRGEFVLEDPPTAQPSEWHAWFRKTQNECANAVKAEAPTDKQTALLKYVIERSWRAYVEPYHDDCLTDRLEITFPDAIDAKWRNGEQFYVFPTSYVDHVLCF